MRMQLTRSRFWLIFIVGTLMHGVVKADDYPSKIVRIVVPAPPGGAVDAVARRLSAVLPNYLGQKVLVENRPGASGIIGTELVVQAPPDGYMFVLHASTLVVNRLVLKEKPRFDAMKDLTPIALIATGPLLFVVNPDRGATTVGDFVARAKSKPQDFSFGVGAFGAAGHMAAEQFRLKTGLSDISIVLYKGTGPAMSDLLGGHIGAMMEPLPFSMPHVKAGKLNALAVTGLRRNALMADVPTFEELGFKDMELFTWYGLWGPAKLPKAVEDKVFASMKAALARPDFRSWLGDQGLEPSVLLGESFRAFTEEEFAKYSRVARAANVSAR